MADNHGFLVKNDRFSLISDNEYIVTGWMADGAVCRAFLGDKPLPVTCEKLDGRSDERFGGVLTKLVIRLDGAAPAGGQVRLEAEQGGVRRTVFAISMKNLEKKRSPIRYFIDDVSILKADGLMRIQGWAVGKSPVKVETDAGGTFSEEMVQRYKRYDTAELFDEYPVDINCGFNIEIRPIPSGKVRVRFSMEDEELILSWSAGAVASGLKKAQLYAQKAADTLRYGGMGTLASKTWNKLFNPAMRVIQYGKWIGRHLPGKAELERQARTHFAHEPLVSIVVPCYRTPEKYLRELVASVVKQSYAKWELILSDGSGPDSPIRELLDALSAEDARIRVLHHDRQLRIAENTNAAIGAAKGEWLAFADHDDLLVASALFELVRLLDEDPEAELVYTDEDKIGPGDKLMQPNLKPDFSPDFLNSVNYICHLLFVRTDLAHRAGLPDPAYEGAQDHDFILRCTEKTDRIRHIPKILYHWRFFEGSTAANPESKMYAFDAGCRAVQAHLDRMGWPATAEKGEYPGLYRVRWHWPEEPMVTVLIPNKDHLEDLKTCIRSLTETTTWSNYEILIVENNSTDEATFRGYEELKAADPHVRVITYEGPFNYSAINNLGVRESRGEYILFLNNDTESTSDCIREMMGFAMRPDVGAVGARLYYADDTVQHAGAIVGWGGVAGHAFVNQPRGITGYQHRIICQQNYSAVTAACMMVPRRVFEEAGGFTEELAVAFNDIDLCMKIRALGYLIVYNPFAELYHYESKSRGLENTPEKQSRFSGEIKLFQSRWPEILRDGDPYYNPNLSMVTQDFSLKKN